MLRNLVGVLVAAAVGIHCSAAADSTDAAAEAAELAAAGDEDARREEPRRSAPPDESATAPERPDFMTLVHDSSAPSITSSVTDDSGATYATGTFVGAVSMGDTIIRSRGEKDVFLVKHDPTGAFVWVRAVGSASMESAPHVALHGKSVSIIGMTKGEMDCGSGPLATWTSATFFLCMFGGADGTPQSGGVFPTGSP